MSERMLNKEITPTEDDIIGYISSKSFENIKLIKEALEKHYKIDTELKFPYGNHYGWCYRISREINNKLKFLFNIFFEKGRILIHMRIDIKSEKEIEKYNKLSEEGKKYWENRYPCGKDGGKHSGWINYGVINKEHLKDIGIFLSIKTNKEIKI